MKIPRVSVVMPVYNGEKHLASAIVSVLEQTFADFEFLILDDGSTDSSVEIMRGFADPRIRIISNGRNLGLIETLNRGIDLAEGDYIARMDCDDVCLEKRFERQVAYMDAHPAVGVCGTWVKTIGIRSGEVYRYPLDSAAIMCRLLFDSPLAHPSVMLRKSMLDKFALRYDPRRLHAEDWDLWQRCAGCFELANVPEVLFLYRISVDSVSRRNAEAQLTLVKLLDRENLQRLCGDISEEDIDLHRRLGGFRFTCSRSFVLRARDWLLRLQECNSRRQLFPEPQFSQMLADKWFELCSASAPLGMWMWRTFWKTTLSGARDRPRRHWAIFAWRCVAGRIMRNVKQEGALVHEEYH